MNGLIILAILLLLFFTVLGIYTYIQDRREMQEISKKARDSGLIEDNWDD